DQALDRRAADRQAQPTILGSPSAPGCARPSQVPSSKWGSIVCRGLGPLTELGSGAVQRLPEVPQGTARDFLAPERLDPAICHVPGGFTVLWGRNLLRGLGPSRWDVAGEQGQELLGRPHRLFFEEGLTLRGPDDPKVPQPVDCGLITGPEVVGQQGDV